jgi:DNA-binding transcriptional LysR family regulator
MLNPRHLQTFYFVALHGGISRAVPHMPYGIQQPAISEQIAELETAIGQKLFKRQPFQLTSAGRALFAPVAGFFRELNETVRELQRQPVEMRIGAEELLIQHYLPPAIARMLGLNRELRFSLHSGSESEMTRRLQNGEVDLVLTALADRPPAGIAKRVVAEVNLALLVAINASITSADELWLAGPEITQPLVCSAASHGVIQIFERGLSRGGIRWPNQIVTSSLASVPALVATGVGIGVTLDLPDVPVRRDVRMLPLVGFDRARVSVLWRPKDTRRLQPLVQIIAEGHGRDSELSADGSRRLKPKSPR